MERTTESKKQMKKTISIIGLLMLAGSVFGAPLPKPPLYFNDEAHIVSAPVASALNEKLAENERKTSNQLLVCIYTELPKGNELVSALGQSINPPDLFTLAQESYNAWGVGQKDKRNGAVLFVFVNDHKARIHVGYGLEGALPDALTNEIQQRYLVPAMKSKDYDAGFTRVVDELIRVTDPEYKGTGKTVAERNTWHPTWVFWFVIAVIVLIILIVIVWALSDDDAGCTPRRWVSDDEARSMMQQVRKLSIQHERTKS